MAPNAGEDVVQLDVDGAERQEAGHHHLRHCRAVPRQRRHLPRIPVLQLGSAPGHLNSPTHTMFGEDPETFVKLDFVKQVRMAAKLA